MNRSFDEQSPTDMNFRNYLYIYMYTLCIYSIFKAISSSNKQTNIVFIGPLGTYSIEPASILLLSPGYK